VKNGADARAAGMGRTVGLRMQRMLVAVIVLLLSGGTMADPSTGEDRAALFDYILGATLQRTAFSPKKTLEIGADVDLTEAEYVRRAMIAYRPEVIAADTDEKLYYALSKISNTRWDTHVEGVKLVEGGLQPASVLKHLRRPGERAPIKFRPDYGNPDSMFLFVSDFSRDFHAHEKRVPRIGDRLVGINNQPIDSRLESYRAYFGMSSRRALWWTMAETITEKALQRAPPSFYDGDRIKLELQSREGERYTLTLPYLKDDAISWMGYDDQLEGRARLSRQILADPDLLKKKGQIELSLSRYKGFEHVFSRPAFDLYVSRAKRIVLLQGHSFLEATIGSDLAELTQYARTHDMFDYAVIYDLTRGGGGDLEEYTLQRLQSRPFKIMFGNLRISDITPALASKLRVDALRQVDAAGKRSTPVTAASIDQPDGGDYLLAWLDHDLSHAIQEKQAYSNTVQFKNQFLPTSSDGFLYPAAEHFTGPMVLFTSPAACSGADQFAAMFIENNLGLSVGMPQGGCSNSWEWDEVLTFPISEKRVVGFSWSVGHSIGPDGAVLEGDSPRPRIEVPLTRDNYDRYYDVLMAHALDYIDQQRSSGRREPTRFDRITAADVERSPGPAQRKREHTVSPMTTYHQHLLSPVVAELWSSPSGPHYTSINADKLIEQLDAGGIRRAVVLSVAYTFGDPRRQMTDEYALVRAENDWTAAEAKRYPLRLIAFCAFNPLRSYALEEMSRCRDELHIRGIKLHLGNSGVSLRNPEHLTRLAEVFRKASALGLAVVVHMKTRSQVTPDYGRPDAENFLDKVISQAPDIPIQIAHMGGSGPGYPSFADEVMAVFAQAIAAGDPRTRNLLFDITTVVTMQSSPKDTELLAGRIRQVGPQRVLFGADLSIGGNLPPAESWKAFQLLMPLIDQELETIASNVAPYWK
jgi:uncharacterized protein